MTKKKYEVLLTRPAADYAKINSIKKMEECNMLVSAAEMLKKAKAGHYAVGQFNINNLEWTPALIHL